MISQISQNQQSLHQKFEFERPILGSKPSLDESRGSE